MKKIVVLTQYPISSAKARELREFVGEDFSLVILANMNSRRYSELLSSIISVRPETLYLLIGKSVYTAALPILTLVSVFMRATVTRVLVEHENRFEFRELNKVWQLAKLFADVALNIFDLIPLRVQLRRLLYASRSTVFNRLRSGNILYLRTTMWLGVQAGGALSHTRGVVNAFARAGQKVMFVSTDLPQRHLFGDSVEFMELPLRRAYTVPRELNHFSFGQFAFKFLRRRAERAPSFIYQRYSTGNFSGVLLSRYFRAPLVLEYNGSENWLADHWGTPYRFRQTIDDIEKICIRHAHLIVAVSDALKNELLNSGADADRILVIPNGMEAADFDLVPSLPLHDVSVRAELSFPPDAIVVSFVGTFGPWHGVETLAEAAVDFVRRARERNDVVAKRVRFVLIGDGVRRAKVAEIIEPLASEGLAVMPGLVPLERIPAYLGASDILVAPTAANEDGTSFFGSPTKLFEYMGAGRPIIASKIGQIEEVLDGALEIEDVVAGTADLSKPSCGVFVRPGNTDDLVNALGFVVKNSEWSIRSGEYARAVAREKFTWDRHELLISQRLRELAERDAAQPLCVLVNALHSKSGGGVTYLRNIVSSFANARNLKLHVCIHESQLELFEGCLDNVTVHVLKFKQGLLRLMVHEQIVIPMLARRIRSDVVFSPANYAPILLRNNVILLRNSLEVALVEPRLSKKVYWFLLYAATTISIMRCRHAIAVSNYARHSASGGLSEIFPRKFSLVPHGVSNDLHPDPTIRRDENFLLIVSDIYVQKNILQLVTAFAKISAAFPEFHLKIAGSPLDVEYLTALKAVIAKHDLTEKVRFLGKVQEDGVRRLYQSCTVFVFPSTVETFGNPLVEAMACGCPIACSNTAAMPEVAGDAVAYFDPNDVDGMAGVILELLRDPARREELGRKAAERAGMYSWEKTAKQTAQVLIDAARD